MLLSCSVALVVSDSVRPHRWQPTRLPHSWGSPGKNTGVGCHFLLQCMKVESESEVAQSCPLCATPWTAAYQAPSSMGFSRQEYWSALPLPSPMNKASGGLFLPPQNLGSGSVAPGSQLLWFQTSIGALCMRPGCWVKCLPGSGF